jgi:hypothetical protein
VLLLLLPSPARAEELPDLSFVAPLVVEGGPVISPGRAVAPQTFVYASVAAGGGSWAVGLAEYTEVFGRVVVGGAWSPSFFPRLELGGDMVVLAGHAVNTVMPPAIDEWSDDFDLGELRVHVSALVWELDLPDESMQLGLRPHLRLTLPTDISRWNEGRRAAPLRRVLGDDIREHEFVLTDLGGSFAWRWTFLTLYETLGFVFGGIGSSTDQFQFLLAATTGIGFDTGDVGLEFVLELNYLGRLTDAPAGAGQMHALAVSPGVRWRTGDLRLGIESRIGLVEGAEAAYGDATVGVTARYDF